MVKWGRGRQQVQRPWGKEAREADTEQGMGRRRGLRAAGDGSGGGPGGSALPNKREAAE